MIEYILLAIVKVGDNIIQTAKSISTQLAIVIVAVSSGIGNFLAFEINSHFKKAAKWVFVLTSSDAEDVQRLCGYLAEHKIKYIANNGLTRKNEPTIHVIAFSKSKDESRLIERFLENSDSKYLKEII